MCCACVGTCNHVGNHTYCAAHAGPPIVPVYVPNLGTWSYMMPLGQNLYVGRHREGDSEPVVG